ncbi:neurogenic locus notch 2 -like protein [Brachionus plicatilis]|uniref:Neurogenic locus notch 2-like protein n=1 Tax=Brachionus plicatilis TaxID=10195 RepID=A0A3M7TAC8_BRAPC|nr:neurogenic locus notch 2 -like protein [Brachionus plicatilis]
MSVFIIIIKQLMNFFVEFCNTEYLCNIDWLLRNNLTNFNILQTSNEFNVNDGIENTLLDINTIALLECFDLCPFGKINSSNPNHLDLTVIKTNNDSFKIVQFLTHSIFNVNLKLNYKIFFSHFLINNMSANNFSVEIKEQSLTNFNFNRTYFSSDLFRNETLRENVIIEFRINNDSFTSDNKSNYTNDKIENVLSIELDTTNLKNYFQTSDSDEKTSDFPQTQEILGSNKTILKKLKSDHLIHVLENKYNLDGCLKECSNHGDCVYDKFKDSYICQCLPSFAGQACEINLEPCSSLQCLNNGTCVSFKNRTFFCICSPISYGKRCEKLVDVCHNQTCSKNGICEPFNHKPKCKCFKSFYGNNCEHETQEQIVVKRVRKASLIISIFVLISFFSIIFCLDLASSLGVNDGSDKKKKKNVTLTHRLVYVNKNSNKSET